jgi:hypothetical protein
LRIARIINHFVSNGHKILIRSSEDSGVAFAMVFYLVWSYYFNNDGTKKEHVKKPEISVASHAIKEIRDHRIETDLDQFLVQRIYSIENKFAGVKQE